MSNLPLRIFFYCISLLRNQSPLGVIMKVIFSSFPGEIFDFSEWIFEKSLILEIPNQEILENSVLCLLADWTSVLSFFSGVLDGNSLFESVNQPESILGDDFFLLGQLFQF